MDPSVAALHARVADRIPAPEFERRVEAARAEFGGLLDDEACALLVLDELGLNEGAYATLGDLRGRSEATVRVRVDAVDPPRSFERAGRDPGRVVNVRVSDATGESRVVFWDQDVEKAEELRPGAHVVVVNARVKEGNYGAELHVGPWTRMEVEGALDPARRKLLADVAPEKGEPVQTRLPSEELPTTLEGRLVWLGPTRPFRGKDGATAFVCEADVETSEGLRRLVAWDAHVKALRGLPIGGALRASGLQPKVKGATTEWHAGRESVVGPA